MKHKILLTFILILIILPLRSETKSRIGTVGYDLLKLNARTFESLQKQLLQKYGVGLRKKVTRERFLVIE